MCIQLKKVIQGDFNRNPVGGTVHLREEVVDMRQVAYYYVGPC
jgi:hypothetical protein